MSNAFAIVTAKTTGTRMMMVPPPPGSPGEIQASSPAMKRRRLRLSPGQIIAGTSWRITRWLGEGSMGVVYEAVHVEIGRRAAIKVVAASLAEDPAAVDDFRGEASASAKIGSPNIIDVFDFAVLEDGRLMMAMEFVSGRSLHDVQVIDGRLPPGRVIGLIRQVCKGLQAAHVAGLVHRDIKPENIMIGDVRGRPDSVKIVDFGIATMLGERSKNSAGTPYYMPPEGLMGGTIDGRYDIYSVGCMMYEMLTGKPPYVHDKLERVLEMHMYDPVPELVTSDDTVPDKLIEIIRRCLAKQASERYESMLELEAALCEAQIEGNLYTSWDDLELPMIEPERRAKLLAKMPTRTVKRGVSGWWLPVLLGFGVLVGGVIAWPLLRPDAAVDLVAVNASEAAVQGFVERIRESAAMAYYIYPPVDDPQADTAYKVLTQLEALDTNESKAAAETLRTELAETLVRLGDDIWSKPGGESYALDFYVQAIMFDPGIESAQTRAALSVGERLTLKRKAETGDFSETELIAVEPLLALAEPNENDQQARLELIETRRRGTRRASATAQLDALIVKQAGAASPTVDLAAEAVAVSVSEIEPPAERTGAADRIVAKANAARKATRLNEAEKLYHKALRVEQHRGDALSGLGRVYFQQGNYSKSVTYYQMAVRRSSRDAALRISLGDALLKTLDYAGALEQYEQGKALGSSTAANRIARIEKRTAG